MKRRYQPTTAERQAIRELIITATNALNMLKLIGDEDRAYYAPYTITDLERSLETIRTINDTIPAPSK